MFIHFVVCLFANSDGWIQCQDLSSRASLQFVCLSKEKLLTGTFSFNHVLLTGAVPLEIYKRQEAEL